MTLTIVLNVIFAAFVLITIPGMLVWAIRSSSNETPAPNRLVRRPRPHPSFASARISSGHRRPAGARGPVQDVS
jgi:hypothetical protein